MLMGDPRNRAQVAQEALAEQARQAQARSGAQRFVTFALGASRFGLESAQVKEVVMPDRVYSFPHTMTSLEGVLVRRGAAIPVCNVGGAFGNGAPCSRYVIVQCSYRGASYSVAIPVSGDCELVQGEREDPDESSSPVTDVTFVSGLLRTVSGTVPLLDMDRIVAHCIQPQHAIRVQAEEPVSAGVGCSGLNGKEARQ